MRMDDSTYLLNGSLHDISNDAHVLDLAQPKHPTNRLVFDGGVPLRLENMDPACHREVVQSMIEILANK